MSNTAAHPFPVLYISKDGFPVVAKDSVPFEAMTLTGDIELHRCATGFTHTTDLVRWLAYSRKAANHIGIPFASIKDAIAFANTLLA